MKFQPLNTSSHHPNKPLFQSFFIAGFECSIHKNGSHKRLDLIKSTQHDTYALKDYLQMDEIGIRVAREGLRWHLIEKEPGKYDWGTVQPIINAAETFGVQVMWDICHFGWPDHVDVMTPDFIEKLSAFGAAFASYLKNNTSLEPFFVPINEISFLAYVGGDEGKINPYLINQGDNLKKQLVKAAIATMEAIWKVNSDARFMHVEPAIHVTAHPDRPQDRDAAEAYRLLQFQAWDMLSGKMCPELGGDEKYLDIVGVNYYIHNQWHYDLINGKRSHEFIPLDRNNPSYRPFRKILEEIYTRYKRPMFIAETGAEGDARAPWLQYVGKEVQAALQSGIPINGICLYPILNHPGWEDDRHCPNGLWDYADANGNREPYEPLRNEILKLQKTFTPLHTISPRKQSEKV